MFYVLVVSKLGGGKKRGTESSAHSAAYSHPDGVVVELAKAHEGKH
jgi:hypothetical protein